MILVSLYYFFIWRQSQLLWNNPQFTIWQELILEGRLELNDNVSLYTHKIDIWSGVFWLRSSNINLFDYTGKNIIKGEITDIIENIPIVSIQEIIAQEETQNTSFVFNKKFYFSPVLWLGINLAPSKGYEIQEDQDKISIIDTENDKKSEIFTLSSFQCSPWKPLQDCQQLLDNFSKDNQRSYTNTQWKIFYNLPETNTRIHIDTANNRWYYLYPKDDNIFNVFINLLYMYSDDDIKKAAVSSIDWCKTITTTLDKIIKSEISYPEIWQASVRVIWEIWSWESYSCIVDVKLDTTLEAKISQKWTLYNKIQENTMNKISQDSNAKSWSIMSGENIGSISKDNLALKGTNTSWEQNNFGLSGTKVSVIESLSWNNEDLKYIWWLKHESVRWYSIYYSKRNIKFYGQMIDNSINLWIPWISCGYMIHISPYTSTGETTDVELYECKWQPSPTELSNAWYQFIGTTGSVSFIAKYLTSTLQDLKIHIQ